MVDPRQLQVTNVEQVLQGHPLNTATVATQMGCCSSRDFIVSVMDDLNLFDDPEFNPALRRDHEHRATSLPTLSAAAGAAGRAICPASG